MNFEDIKRDWQMRDQQLQETIKLNTKWLRMSYIEKNGNGSRRWAMFLFLAGLPCYVLTMDGLGFFVAHHIAEIKFVAPALALFAWCAVMFIVRIFQFSAIRKIDWGQPVMVVQKRLAQLKVARLRTLKWGLMTGVLLWWIPFLIVIAKAIANIDLYVVAPHFLAYQFGASMVLAAVIGVIGWIARRYSDRWPLSKLTGAFLDSIAGQDLASANQFLHQLSNFDQEIDITMK